MSQAMHLNRSTALDIVALVAAVALAALSAQTSCSLRDGNDLHQWMHGFGRGVVLLNPPALDPVTCANMDTLILAQNRTRHVKV